MYARLSVSVDLCGLINIIENHTTFSYSLPARRDDIIYWASPHSEYSRYSVIGHNPVLQQL
ncbi:MAG: hypothetical protein J07HQW2_01213 [Haloquadratum walsbyi J07HQW2]|uniref:Uncharacterized protein n=1 Tax=Haloquadratum walsbyi J07HQW2 TaxID=1238425 RepID=U1PR08_9EURY|nr:MAG: hypothetical protein J07HQW2_01213 [Haloquadratum walsbyi J07HQW2]